GACGEQGEAPAEESESAVFADAKSNREGSAATDVPETRVSSKTPVVLAVTRVAFEQVEVEACGPAVGRTILGARVRSTRSARQTADIRPRNASAKPLDQTGAVLPWREQEVGATSKQEQRQDVADIRKPK